MKDITFSALRLRGVEFLPPLGILAAAGIFLSVGLREPAGLSAAAVSSHDSDADGVCDKQELILGTSIGDPDTDHDGFGDAEEVARGSSPINTTSMPSGMRISVGMSCRNEKGLLHALVAVYLPDGDPTHADVSIGISSGHRISKMPDSFLADSMSVDYALAADPNALVAMIDIPFDKRWVQTLGHLTVFATAGPAGSGTNTAAASIQLAYVSGMIVLVVPDPSFVQTPTSQPVAGLQNPVTRGSIYVPLPDDGGSVPSNWAPGQTCYQISDPVAVHGAVVTHEVVSADCQTSLEGYCAPDCASSVGSTFEVVDPLILLGG